MRLVLASALVLAAATGSAYADPDVAKGETVFKKCMACHAIGPDAKVKVGPPLNGIVGAKWAHFEGYAYSQDIKDGAAAGKVWDEATLNDYIENPKHLVPKGKMAFAGVKNEDERKDLIAFLAQFKPDGSK
ncbi:MULTISPECIES: c-type cytochrome [Xanthobacter]|uniref:Cytochrome c family protein n=1 Tax=Xanthobacter aminoxidans TaxID=186280 RepID=A0ABW6ZM26_9HYPH|nr:MULTISPECIES: cytochrome c family protein [Xanthobacter]MCL8381933.1 cytochrome c family protein [Xanthobacter aminoxidans]